MRKLLTRQGACQQFPAAPAPMALSCPPPDIPRAPAPSLPAGYLYCSMPVLNFTQGMVVRFHVMALGTEGERVLRRTATASDCKSSGQHAICVVGGWSPPPAPACLTPPPCPAPRTCLAAHPSLPPTLQSTCTPPTLWASRCWWTGSGVPPRGECGRPVPAVCGPPALLEAALMCGLKLMPNTSSAQPLPLSPLSL